MCLAIPGKVEKVMKDKVIVCYDAEKREAKFIGIELKKGDYVLVQQGFVVNRMDKKSAEDSLKAWRSIQ
ncbi:HypC/HybG/HupF family hydrogenase formation chaperone [Candidatus Woesearchaeota archaeon]|nr:HypC/HybG/HupF family hydrogenase formation chaperone [Candidatus Woesearchaeota archaeon]